MDYKISINPKDCIFFENLMKKLKYSFEACDTTYNNQTSVKHKVSKKGVKERNRYLKELINQNNEKPKKE